MPNSEIPRSAHTLPLSVHIGQFLRWLLKATLWETLSAVPLRLGHPLQTVQVLVVDSRQGQVLLLRTRESKTGYFPVQGLRSLIRDGAWRLVYGEDAREDARRELAEEAVATALAVEQFKFLLRYDEGRHGQFDCRVYWVEVRKEGIVLLDENSEGKPVWKTAEEAGQLLNQTLAGLLASSLAAP
jgi:hypothetical protein